MNAPIWSLVPEKPFHLEQIAPGVSMRRLYPGGKAGPDNIVANAIPGGQTWSESIILGDEHDDFMMCVPDIRMPPNQIWPLHWHDCWTLVIIVEGNCMIGDWYMGPGDVFIAEPSIEYGPLLIGPAGCRLLEVFGDLSLSPGGYSPEYRDHPTLRGGNHVIKPREGINKRNEGHSSLTLEGTSGMWKARLENGWTCDLGAKDDPGRGVLRDTRLTAGEKIAAVTRGDAYAALVLGGSVDVGGRTFVRDDVLVATRGSAIPEMVAGKDGVELLEHFRTAAGFDGSGAMKFNHVGISVTDLDRSIAFYRDMFGMEPLGDPFPFGGEQFSEIMDIPDAQGRMCMIAGGNLWLELFEFANPPGKAKDPNYPVSDRGISHFGMTVDDIYATYDKLKAAGVPIHGRLQTFMGGGMRAAYCRDPDGNVFEIMQPGEGMPVPES